jgi:membrane protease YdiL (CAAX protease family)
MRNAKQPSCIFGRFLCYLAARAALPWWRCRWPCYSLWASNEQVLFRGASLALLGVAALIGIAALLEELVYRCLMFRVVEQAWGTTLALVVQAVVFALQHLGNVAHGGISDVVTMLVSVTLAGLLWAVVFVLARNLWVVAANHAAWNFTIQLQWPAPFRH